MTSSVKFILKTNEIQTRNNRPNKNRNATKQFNNNSYFSKVMLSLESASKRYSVHYTMYSLKNKNTVYTCYIN